MERSSIQETGLDSASLASRRVATIAGLEERRQDYGLWRRFAAAEEEEEEDEEDECYQTQSAVLGPTIRMSLSSVDQINGPQQASSC